MIFTFGSIFQTKSLTAIPANLCFLTKFAKHDVTLTSLTADWIDPGYLLSACVELLLGGLWIQRRRVAPPFYAQASWQQFYTC